MTDFGKYIFVATSALMGVMSFVEFPMWHESTTTTCQAYVNRLSIEALGRPGTTYELMLYENQMRDETRKGHGMNCTKGYWWTLLHSGQYRS